MTVMTRRSLNRAFRSVTVAVSLTMDKANREIGREGHILSHSSNDEGFRTVAVADMTELRRVESLIALIWFDRIADSRQMLSRQCASQYYGG